MTTQLTKDFVLESPQTLDISASFEASVEPHLHWYLSYEPEQGEDGEHIVIATLHVADETGRAEVSLGARFRPVRDHKWTTEELGNRIKASSALETLYDVASTNIRMVAALTSLAVNLPHKAPAADVEIFATPATE